MWTLADVGLEVETKVELLVNNRVLPEDSDSIKQIVPCPLLFEIE